MCLNTDDLLFFKCSFTRSCDLVDGVSTKANCLCATGQLVRLHCGSFLLVDKASVDSMGYSGVNVFFSEGFSDLSV